MPCWRSLPPEIRLMILELLSEESRGLASYASVCREWQAVIEKKNFAQLKLQASCLHDFERMISRQRKLVKHIWLNIELHKYTCQTCENLEPILMSTRNDGLARRAILKLFSILSSWEENGDLTLELSAQSPSDLKHWFRNCYFEVHYEDNGDIVFETGNRQQETTAELHDPAHDWINGQQVDAPEEEAVLRLFEFVQIQLLVGNLPEVHAVTSFVIRRQCRRQFQPKSLGILLEKLPRLESLVYGPWQAWDRMSQNTIDWEYRLLIEEYLPKGLKRISLFEDFNEDYNSLFEGPWAWELSADPVRIAMPRVGAAFAYRSLDLEHVSLSFMADARDFFGARQPLWTWSNLQPLALTSRMLSRSTENYLVISDLLRDAGTAALYMPKLRTMALWNGRKDEACVFAYRNEGDNPSITWRGTWDMKLGPRVFQAWEQVASKYTQGELRFTKQLFRCDTASSHGDTIPLLELPQGVVDPVSLWQIQKEGSLGWKESGT